jgi:hypothetical protein
MHLSLNSSSQSIRHKKRATYEMLPTLQRFWNIKQFCVGVS